VREEDLNVNSQESDGRTVTWTAFPDVLKRRRTMISLVRHDLPLTTMLSQILPIVPRYDSRAPSSNFIAPSRKSMLLFDITIVLETSCVYIFDTSLLKASVNLLQLF
jgi:hypothetical protein